MSKERTARLRTHELLHRGGDAAVGARAATVASDEKQSTARSH
jgi:hypothetical protein